MTANDNKVKLVAALVERISPILHGNGPDVQGAVLADLMAMWLAGHIVLAGENTADKTDDMRAEIFEDWIRTVVKLIPCNHAALMERALAAMRSKVMQ